MGAEPLFTHNVITRGTNCVCRRSPALGGEVVAVDRNFFHSVGGYDPGMLLWGEEQVELSIRVRASHRGTIIHLLAMQRVTVVATTVVLWEMEISGCTSSSGNIKASIQERLFDVLLKL